MSWEGKKVWAEKKKIIYLFLHEVEKWGVRRSAEPVNQKAKINPEHNSKRQSFYEVLKFLFWFQSLGNIRLKCYCSDKSRCPLRLARDKPMW